MNSKELALWRMANLRLSGKRFETPVEVVQWLGAVQAQDFGPAKWSIGQRSDRVKETAVDAAFAKGDLLRTHVLRPTWHFVLPEDIRWMLELTGPRVTSKISGYQRQLGLDEALFKKANRLITRALRGSNFKTRKELGLVLNKSGIDAVGGPLAFIVMQAELSGLVCSGPVDGKQHTYALLDERAPSGPQLTNDEALADLTRRYFTSHGPATIKDFSWWSSLKVGDIRHGLEMIGSSLQSETIDGLTYWFKPPKSKRKVSSKPIVHLLQGYDEYIVGYTESKFLLNLASRAQGTLRDRPMYTGAVAVNGQVEGHWRRRVDRGAVVLDVALYEPFDDLRTAALQRATAEYAKFLESEVAVQISLI